jgi:coatomer protein complex subunit alpha (xenin)
MQVIAERAKDLDSRMHVALLRDDAMERVRVLESVGQVALAYVTAKVNHLPADVLARLEQRVQEEKLQIEYEDFGAPLARALPPLFGTRESWPLTDSITASSQAKMEKQQQQQQLFQQPESEVGQEVEEEEEEEEEEEQEDELNVSATDAWGGGEDEIDLSDEELAPAVTSVPAPAAGRKRNDFDDDEEEDESGFFSTVQRGVAPTSKWVASSTLASDHVAAGSFDTAMKLLNRQIGITNFAPMKRTFLQIRASAQAYLVEPAPLSQLPVSVFPTRERGEFPLPIISLASLREGKLANCFDLFSKAKFAESLQEFRVMLQTIPLVVCATTAETLELAQLLAYCREYIIAITLKLESEREGGGDPKRQFELSAYLTRRDLQPAHLLLVCKVAMVKAFKLENYITAAHFAKRILALPGVDHERNAKLKSDAQKVLQKSEREGRNAIVDLIYSQDQSFELDVVTLAPLLQGAVGKRCPFCQSTSAAQGELCPVCELSPIGVETLGLVSMTKRS